ncbi:FkbM family methyltransferase [Parablautia muri]|nr:FkbM family methyltransferase [Parablautia muri]
MLTEILQDKKIILYGAGCCGAIVAELFNKQGKEIYCFFDANQKKKGTSVMGIRVEQPHWIEEPEQYCIIVCLLKRGVIYTNILKNMQQLGYPNISHIYDWKNYRELFQDQALIISPDVKKIKRNWQSYEWLNGKLADQESKETLKAVLEFMLDLDEFGIDHYPLEEQYFAYDIYHKIEDEYVIDCGAFKGEVMDIFIKKNAKYAHYMAIEPDKAYVKELERKREEKGKSKITVVSMALSDCRETLCLSNYGNENSIIREDGTERVEATKLDEFAKEYPCTFLKIDVEGYEKKVLKGAEKVIRKWQPIIAVAAYHHEEDFYELYKIIEEMTSGYSFYLRSYMNLHETILYAIPEHRRSKQEIN